MLLQPLAITGDRPTGPLHLGHYVGSLRTRLALQSTHRLTVLVADLQALTDHSCHHRSVAAHIPEVMKDYLAVGLDPDRVTFVLQSAVPELAELTVLLLNLVSVARLERNPTVRQELVQKDLERAVPAGFLCYPVSQAADIIGLGGGTVPVGVDQLPMIEITRFLIDQVNVRGPQRALPTCEALLSDTPRLPGINGQAKMSKTLGNALTLSASTKEVAAAVQQMYTDPQHLRVSDPGTVEGNVVFTYLDAFDPDTDEVAALKAHYRRGGLGDSAVKRRLTGVLEECLAPIRDRRAALDGHDARLRDLLRTGTAQARIGARAVLGQVREALGVPDL